MGLVGFGQMYKEKTMKKYTLSVLVENTAGVLSRISGLFARRGYNIDSLAVGETDTPELSRMTIIVKCDDQALIQITEQLKKLVCVKTVKILSPESSVISEFFLVKVKANLQNRSEIIQVASIFRAKIIDVTPKTMTLEITGEGDKTSALLELLRDFGILEVVRTGSIALERGEATIYGE